MSLVISACKYAWTRHRYDSFRQKLTQHEGIDLNQMEGFGTVDHPVPWTLMTTPFSALLCRPEAEGTVISPADCARMYGPLRQAVLKMWPVPDESEDFHRAMDLVDGMQWCAENDEALQIY